MNNKSKAHLLDNQQAIDMATLLALKQAGKTDELERAHTLMQERAEAIGEALIDRAVKDKMLTYGEWTDWAQKYGAGYVDEEAILKCAYSAKEKKHQIIILTAKDSASWRMKQLLKKRFNVGVMTQTEFILNDWDRHPENRSRYKNITSRAQLERFLKSREAQ